jgi:Protein of unknown function (DUF4238)
MRGYKKAVEGNFPCSPKDVCREWNWDINPLFKDNPGLLADFRKAFEPHWNPAIGEVRSGRISSEEKFVLAGYWAQLTTCTPAWHAHAVEMYERQVLDFIPLVAAHVARQRPADREYIEKALAEGRIVPDIDGNHVKGVLTQQLTRTISVLYHQDWFVVRNTTEMPFITSDNPSSIFPRRGPTSPLVRFLPLAPDLGLIAVAAARKGRDDVPLPDLTKPPPGVVRSAIVDRKRAARLNRITVMNANELVFCIGESRQVARLVRNHRRFGLATDRVTIGPIHGAILTLRHKPKT